MNTTTSRIALATSLLAAALASAPAPAAEAASLTIDCAAPSLPTQAEVGNLLDLQNQGQVYAARARLMGQAGRACRKQGTRTVVLVVDPGRDAGEPAATRGLASAPKATP